MNRTLIVVFVLAAASAGLAQSKLVSTNASEELAFSAALGPAAVSTDGTFVAWSTAADNLDAGDLNGERDVYRKNTVDFSVLRASLAFDLSSPDEESGVLGFGAGLTNNVAISGDGRLVAFSSVAVLVEDLDNAVSGRNIYVRDMVADTITMVSAGTDANDLIIQGGTELAISDDGSRIAFLSISEFVPETNPGAEIDVFVSFGGVISRVSTNAAGEESDGTSLGPIAMNGDGTFVAFQSGATNFGGGGGVRLYVKDTVTGALRVPAGIGANPSLNGDGCVLAYETADALVPEDTNTVADVYVEDFCLGTLAFASPRLDGVVNNRRSGRPSISDDGTRVVFESEAQLVAEDTNNELDVYFFDLEEGELQLVSVSDAGEASTGTDDRPTITGDGEFVVYRSNSANIGDRPPGNNSTQLAATPLGLRGTDLALTASTREGAGNTLLDIEVTNRGPIDIQELRLTLDLDDGEATAFPGCPSPPNCIETSLATPLLVVGETKAYTGIEVSFPGPGVKALTVTAASELPELAGADNVVELEVIVDAFTDLEVTLSRQDSSTGSKTEQVIAVVRNISEEPAEDATLQIAGDDRDLSFSAIDCPGVEDGDTCALGDLAAGAEVTVAYRLNADGDSGVAGAVATATVFSARPEENIDNNTDSITLLLVGGCKQVTASTSLALFLLLGLVWRIRRRAR